MHLAMCGRGSSSAVYFRFTITILFKLLLTAKRCLLLGLHHHQDALTNNLPSNGYLGMIFDTNVIVVDRVR